MEKKASELELMVQSLEESGQYKVLRRAAPKTLTAEVNKKDTRSGLFVDVETTGLNPHKDEIIELAMVPFTYTVEGEILGVQAAFQQLNEPRESIPSEITELTGITNEMVSGKRLDVKLAAKFALKPALIIAHNASFDRPFLEQLDNVFANKPWACSMSEVSWSAEGYESTKLSCLAMEAGFFYDKHRAINDCFAAIELLSKPLPKTGRLAFSCLLEQARSTSWRIWAENAPFEMKDNLKARGYRWNGSDKSAPRAWYIDTVEATRDTEIAYLKSDIFKGNVDLMIQEFTAIDRFSERT